MYTVEVDQSGKIGDTKVPTVLAFSNSENHAILISATVKRACIRELRQRGQSGTNLYLRLFVIGLCLLLERHIQDIALVTIDIEYLGHNARIKEHLLNLLRRAGYRVSREKIRFRHIGKKSNAHKRAKSVFTGATEPDRRISLKVILARLK